MIIEVAFWTEVPASCRMDAEMSLRLPFKLLAPIWVFFCLFGCGQRLRLANFEGADFENSVVVAQTCQSGAIELAFNWLHR
jgi:hypothetical protein